MSAMKKRKVGRPAGSTGPYKDPATLRQTLTCTVAPETMEEIDAIAAKKKISRGAVVDLWREIAKGEI